MVTINTAKATPADGFLDIPLEFIMVMNGQAMQHDAVRPLFQIRARLSATAIPARVGRRYPSVSSTSPSFTSAAMVSPFSRSRSHP